MPLPSDNISASDFEENYATVNWVTRPQLGWISNVRDTQGDGSALPLAQIGTPEKFKSEIVMEYPLVQSSGGLAFWAPHPGITRLAFA